MTFHSSIIAASPLALSAAFAPPFLSSAPDSAVISIRGALAQLPVAVRDSSLDELSFSEWDRLEAAWRAARVEHTRLAQVFDAAEKQSLELRPEQPAMPETPKVLGYENIQNMTLAEIASQPRVRAPEWVKYDAEMEVWKAACSTIDQRTGCAAAEVAAERALEESWRACRALLSLPAPDINYIARKLEVIREEVGTVENEDMSYIWPDIERLGVAATRLSGGDEDRRALAAFHTYRASRLAHLDLPDEASDEVANEILCPGDRAFDELIETKPSKLTAILAKLHVGFSGLGTEAWIDEVFRDPGAPEFRKHVEQGDCYHRLIFSAIEDLARVTGVDLSKPNCPEQVH